MTNNKYGWDSPDEDIAENYIKKCISFVNDDRLFNNFKSDTDFQHIVESNKFTIGQTALKNIDKNGEMNVLLRYLTLFKENEKIGNPELSFFEGVGEVASSTLRYANTYLEIKKLLLENIPKKIVEIGGGYGGLCKILSSVYNFDEYILIDLPPVIELCKKYLSNFKELDGKIKFLYVSKINSLDTSNIDLVIADSSLAECDLETQIFYTKNILSKSKYIYMVYNTLHVREGMKNFNAVMNILANYNGTIEGTMKNETGKQSWNIRLVRLKRKEIGDTSPQIILNSHRSYLYKLKHMIYPFIKYLKRSGYFNGSS